MIDVLAIDPGLARFGAVLVGTDGREHTCNAVDVFASEPRVSDFDIRLADDRVRRTRDLSAWLTAFVGDVRPRYVAAEAMSFPRGAQAIVAMSLAWGVVCRFLEARRLPMVSAMPGYWRTCLINERSRRRGKVETAVREARAHAVAVRAVPSFPRLARRLKDEHQLHVLDALGVFVWSTQTPMFRHEVRR